MKVVTKTQPTYDLIGLTREEMVFLADLMGAIGGSSTESRRKHADALYEVLAEAGFEWDRKDHPHDYEGSIRFSDSK